MKGEKIIVYFISLVLLCGCKLSFFDSPKIDHSIIKNQVEQRFHSMMNAAFNMDADRYFHFIDKANYVGLNDYGSVIESARVLEEIFNANKQLVDYYASFDFNQLSFHVLSPELVLVITEVTAIAHLKNDKEVQLQGGYSQIWRKDNAFWRVISSSSTVQVR